MARTFYLFSIFIILTFLWRFLVPAHEESDPDTLIYLETLFEVFTVFGLIFFYLYLRSSPYLYSTSLLAAVFWIALAASIGILVMRFSTTGGWYTGHRVYSPG
jgi:hypothetical protein